jgi:hypothetical protein
MCVYSGYYYFLVPWPGTMIITIILILSPGTVAGWHVYTGLHLRFCACIYIHSCTCMYCTGFSYIMTGTFGCATAILGDMLIHHTHSPCLHQQASQQQSDSNAAWRSVPKPHDTGIPVSEAHLFWAWMCAKIFFAYHVWTIYDRKRYSFCTTCWLFRRFLDDNQITTLPASLLHGLRGLRYL